MADGIGSRIREIREREGLNQAAFALKLGSSSGYISELENGKNRPGADFLTSLKRVFKANIDWVLTGEADFPAEAVIRGEVLAEDLLGVVALSIEQRGRLVAILADLFHRGKSEAEIREQARPWVAAMASPAKGLQP